ncbi:MAG: hypothetical protein V4754_15985 [Pseudomonadota bacterium]
MNKLKWLIKRELWEHKGMLVWTPVAIGALMTALAGAMLLLSNAGARFQGQLMINGQVTDLQHLGGLLHGGVAADVAAVLAKHYLDGSIALFMVMGILIFFYCLSALHSDREDRSLLFWKSLPISDRVTVVSKLVLALVVAPLITIGVATASALLILIILVLTMSAKHFHVIAPLLANSELYLGPLRLLSVWPVYFLWALPTVGWLLMVSAWARSKVFLWAVGAPLLVALLGLWVQRTLEPALNIGWYLRHIVGRLLLGLIPGAWFMPGSRGDRMLSGGLGDPSLSSLSGSAWEVLAQPSLWLGVAAGTLMLYAAVRLRRWRDGS